MCKLMQYFSKSVLMFFTVIALSACGGGGSSSSSSTPTVSLTVALFDALQPGAANGQKIQITDGGSINFTCTQSGTLGDGQGEEERQELDSRCATEGAGDNQSSASIVFNSLPTGKTYTLHNSVIGNDAINETCSVTITNTTTLTALSPCASTGTNRITLTIDPGTN